MRNSHLLPLVERSFNEEMTGEILERYWANLRRRGRHEDNEAGWSLFLGGLADPFMLLPAAKLGGIGIRRAIGRGAASIGGVNAVTEAGRSAIDPTATGQEYAMNVGVGFLFASAIGGGLGHLMRDGAASPSWGINNSASAIPYLNSAERYDASFRRSDWQSPHQRDRRIARAGNDLKQAENNLRWANFLAGKRTVDIEAGLNAQRPNPNGAIDPTGVKESLHRWVDESGTVHYTTEAGKQRDWGWRDRPRGDSGPAQRAEEDSPPIDSELPPPIDEEFAPTAVTQTAPDTRVPLAINEMTEAQIVATMKGVGPAKAKAIIEHRTTNGPFSRLDDLINVPGITARIVSDNLEAVGGKPKSPDVTTGHELRERLIEINDEIDEIRKATKSRRDPEVDGLPADFEGNSGRFREEGEARIAKLQKEKDDIENAIIIDPDVQKSIEDGTPRDAMTTDGSTPSGERIARSVREVLKEDVERIRQEVKKLKDEIEELESKASSFRDQAKKANGVQRAFELNEKAEKLENKAAYKLTLKDKKAIAYFDGVEIIENANDLTFVGSARIDDSNMGGLIKGLRWMEHPWFYIKNNTFDGEFGEYIARLASTMADTPGLRMAGAALGRAMETSVESKALQWKIHYRIAKQQQSDDYTELVRKFRPKTFSTSENTIFIEKSRQGVEGAIDAVKNAMPGKANMDGSNITSNRLDGLPTWVEYKELVFQKHHNPGESVNSNPAVDQAALNSSKGWITFYAKFGSAIDELNMKQTSRSAKRNLKRFTEIVNQNTQRQKLQRIQRDLLTKGDPEELSVLHNKWKEEMSQVPGLSEKMIRATTLETWKDVQLQNIDAVLKTLSDQRVRGQSQVEEAAEWVESLSVTKDVDENYFHRMWDLKAIQENLEEFRDILRKWFIENPEIRLNGKLHNMSGSKTDIEERIGMVIDHIVKDAKGDSVNNFVDSRAVRKLDAELAATEISLARFQKNYPSSGPTHKTIIGPTNVGVRGSADYLPAYAEYKKDGTFEIRVDEEFIRTEYEAGRFGVNWKPFFKSTDEFIDFVHRHEQAHTRMRQGILETKKEYEARINKGAWEELIEGKPPKTEEMTRLETKKRLTNEMIIKERNTKNSNGSSSLVGRSLNIPTSRVGKFVNRDMEAVGAMYENRMAPLIETARRFGDSHMDEELLSLREKFDEHLLKATSHAERERMIKEYDNIEQSIITLRDKVNRNFGIAADTTEWGPRVARTLSHWAITTQLGKSVYAALADPARIILEEGLGRTFGALITTWTTRSDEMSAWSKSDPEAGYYGVGMELSTAFRMEQMTGASFSPTAHTTFERVAANSAKFMFVLNGLAHFTDTLSRFSSIMVGDRVIRQMDLLISGKATQKDIMQLADFGITKAKAQRFMYSWKGAGESKYGGLILPDTLAWKDKAAAKDFQTMMGAIVRSQVLTPNVADKMNFLSKPGVQVITLYKGFMLAATNRIVLAGLQGKHAHLMSGVLSMIALGMIVDWLKRPDYIDATWQEIIINGIDQSGVTGLLMEINNMIEGATMGEIGLRPMTGTRTPHSRDEGLNSVVGSLGGPVLSQWSNLIWAFSEGGNDEKARALRYVTPFNNTFMLGSMFDSMQKGPVASAFE